MAHDPLHTLLAVRRHAVDEGRRALADSLEAAAAAAKAARAAELAITREMQRASSIDGGDNLVEAFAAWLPAARQRAAQAQARHDRQEAEVARCRADLTVCRTALEAIEQLIESRDATRNQERSRRDQAELDDHAASKPQAPMDATGG